MKENIEPVPVASLVDINTVADKLGVDVRHVRRLVAERRIEFIKWGKLLRFDEATVDRWIDERRTPPRAQRRTG